MKIEWRLAIKVLNASKFVLSLGVVDDVSAITRPLDLSMLAMLRDIVDRATRTRELQLRSRTRTRRVVLLDVHRRLRRTRQGTRLWWPASKAASAKAALSLALSVQLRLFAPFLPFTTEEVVVVKDLVDPPASWPQVEEFSAPPEGDPGVLEATGQALGGVRKVKSEQVSMRPASRRRRSTARADIERIRQAIEDPAAAGSIEGMNVTDGSETLQVEAELAPVEKS